MASFNIFFSFFNSSTSKLTLATVIGGRATYCNILNRKSKSIDAISGSTLDSACTCVLSCNTRLYLLSLCPSLFKVLIITGKLRRNTRTLFSIYKSAQVWVLNLHTHHVNYNLGRRLDSCRFFKIAYYCTIKFNQPVSGYTYFVSSYIFSFG